ncbi:glycoside hydrolase family 26 protein [Streptomyces sp. XM4193]|uniref:glycosyl hydrolase n=1 Tax=Streptomyces sp. XM4193 TaxID=2929782 RepID=UPI001FF9421F|nr:glycosyl hydrolase [Streptomyces sp. XM4193]MCK1799008.1 glycoside hydrolase family 26 protein [Streptomyces sp. XM4193]
MRIHRSLRSTRRSLAALGVAVLTAAAAALSLAPTSAQALPTADKQAVLDYLHSVRGSGIVSGQHNKEPANQPSQYTKQVHDITGEYPGLWGGDLMFREQDARDRQLVIDQAKTEWANGSLVALSWHACPPTGPSTCEFEGGVKSDITPQEFRDIVTDGTELNATWKSRLDEIAPYLEQLQDDGIPALFRPFHEMNESWNWWGEQPGEDGGARLFQLTRDYLEDTRGLDNLVWVWNVQDNPDGGWDSYYPGDDYADVVSLDVWYKGHPSDADYRQLRDIAGDKPIALAEMGRVPDAQLLESQTEWTYFMVWSEQLREDNTDEEIQAAYYHSRTLNQGELAMDSAAGRR